MKPPQERPSEVPFAYGKKHNTLQWKCRCEVTWGDPYKDLHDNFTQWCWACSTLRPRQGEQRSNDASGGHVHTLRLVAHDDAWYECACGARFDDVLGREPRVDKVQGIAPTIKVDGVDYCIGDVRTLIETANRAKEEIAECFRVVAHTHAEREKLEARVKELEQRTDYPEGVRKGDRVEWRDPRVDLGRGNVERVRYLASVRWDGQHCAVEYDAADLALHWREGDSAKADRKP